jgi:hypothetical protein
MPGLEEKLPIMFSAGQTLMLGGLVVSSFAGSPAVLGMAMCGVGGILLAATTVLAFSCGGICSSAGALVLFPDDPLTKKVPGAALVAYVGVLAIFGSMIAWSPKQVGLVGLLILFVAYFLVGLYLTFQTVEPFVTRDAPDGHFGQ